MTRCSCQTVARRYTANERVSAEALCEILHKPLPRKRRGRNGQRCNDLGRRQLRTCGPCEWPAHRSLGSARQAPLSVRGPFTYRLRCQTLPMPPAFWVSTRSPPTTATIATAASIWLPARSNLILHPGNTGHGIPARAMVRGGHGGPARRGNGGGGPPPPIGGAGGPPPPIGPPEYGGQGATGPRTAPS